MMTQISEWWPILTIIVTFLIAYVIYKIIKLIDDYVQNFDIHNPHPIPGFEGKSGLLYFSLLISTQKKSVPASPSLSAGFQTLVNFCLRYGRDGLIESSLLFKPSVILFKAAAAEAVLNNPKLFDKSREYRFMQPFIGSGLVTSQGTKWRKDRKLLTPAFHFSLLKDFLPVFHEQANILISKIESLIQEPWIDIVPLMSFLTLDIICETAMGISMNFQTGANRDYSEALLEIEEAIAYRMLRPWLHPDIIFKCTALGKKFNSNISLVHEVNKKIIKQKIERMSNEKLNSTADNRSVESLVQVKMRKPFLDLLLEYHLKDSTFTEKDVREHVDTIMLAGHETTSITMSCVLYCLGLHPKVQRQVHEELDAIFLTETGDTISSEVLAEMKYLECVIKETLRIFPTVPFISRENNQNFKVLNRSVKQGTLCLIFIWLIHRDSEIFPDPEKFDPTRFLPENCAKRHPYAYMPFSAGSRNCLGQKFSMMEVKTVLACILRRFRVESLDTMDKILIYPSIVTQIDGPLRLKFVPR